MIASMNKIFLPEIEDSKIMKLQKFKQWNNGCNFDFDNFAANYGC